MTKPKDTNGSEIGSVKSGLGRKKGPWIICSFFLLIVTVIVNTDFESGQLFSRGSMFGQYSLSLPSHSGSPVTPTFSNPYPPDHEWYNVLVENSSNYTSTLLNLLQQNATSGSPCHLATTNKTKLDGLPEPLAGKYLFATDVLHRLTLVALEENGERRCAGGDYFEVDFHSDLYTSRLPTVDFGNGTYGLDLIVPARFAGSFVLEITLLFGNWHGLEVATNQWGRVALVLTEQLQLVDDFGNAKTKRSLHHTVAPLRQCAHADFDRNSWQGRWTRAWFNESCVADEEKRFRCLPEDHFHCEEPWCSGPVGRLESNGWVYSAHCSFKIFEPDEAWKCLEGKWFLMWGDSNLLDTIRNLLLFVMDYPVPRGRSLSNYVFYRNYEEVFINSRSLDQTFQVSQIWTGHINEMEVGEGLNTLRHKEHQQRLFEHFNSSTRWPDTIIMNSGMHDGLNHWTESYVSLVDWVIDWWITFYTSFPADRRPRLLWRTSIAPAGFVRRMPSNPNKLEMYNHIVVEKLKAVKDALPIQFVDTFDLSFPFHYNNEYCDGGHYGRPPGLNDAPWYTRPHWYFVDLMAAHIWLNALCPAM